MPLAAPSSTLNLVGEAVASVWTVHNNMLCSLPLVATRTLRKVSWHSSIRWEGVQADLFRPYLQGCVQLRRLPT
jgi:hypothetical protein